MSFESAREEIAKEREFRDNKPIVAPGMEGDSMSFGSGSAGFGSGFGGSRANFGSSNGFGSSFGGNSGFSSGSYGMPSPLGSPMQQPHNQSAADRASEAIQEGSLKAGQAVLKGIGPAMKVYDSKAKYLKAIKRAISGGAMAAFAIVWGLLGLILPGHFNYALGIFFAGGAMALTGVSGMLLHRQKAMEQEAAELVAVRGSEVMSSNWGSTVEESDDDYTLSDEGSEDEDFDEGWDDEFDDDEFDDEFNDEPEEVVDEPVDMGIVEGKIDSLSKGIMTRGACYEIFSSMIPNITPGFDKKTVYEEGDDEYDDWAVRVRDAATLVGLDTDMVEVIGVSETPALYLVKVSRQSGKSSAEAKLVEEVLRAYQYDDSGVLVNPNASSTYVTVSSSLIITIYKGDAFMVSIKDAYGREENWVKNSDIKAPVILGIDKSNRVLKFDFMKLDSILISGIPRAGKSWLATAILNQVCAYVPPSKLQFSIGDVKGGMSAYTTFKVPHIIDFQGTPDGVYNMVNHVVNVEGQTRKKLLAEYSVTKIQDLPPDVELPYHYVLLDEMTSLFEALEAEDKDKAKELRGLLNRLVTELPATGIRPFFIPHRVIDKIIPKTSSSMIAARIQVGGTDANIEETIGERKFNKKLVIVGDAAVRISLVNNATPTYCHGVVLSKSDADNTKISDGIASMWRKIEPQQQGWFDNHSLTGNAKGETALNEVMRAMGKPVSEVERAPETAWAHDMEAEESMGIPSAVASQSHWVKKVESGAEVNEAKVSAPAPTLDNLEEQMKDFSDWDSDWNQE